MPKYYMNIVAYHQKNQPYDTIREVWLKKGEEYETEIKFHEGEEYQLTVTTPTTTECVVGLCRVIGMRGNGDKTSFAAIHHYKNGERVCVLYLDDVVDLESTRKAYEAVLSTQIDAIGEMEKIEP